MTDTLLTRHDFRVLEKIKDPESSSSNQGLTDSSLPRDPHVTDPEVYASLVQQERECIQSLLHQSLPLNPSEVKGLCEVFDQIIERYPNYASARNNRAQALRMVCGDDILVRDSSSTLSDHDHSHSNSPFAEMILSDLSTAISLLSPSSPYKAIHPTSAKTLSQAYSQRGALYLSAANGLSSTSIAEKQVCLSSTFPEVSWGELEFREAASQDFFNGGRYGNPIAKALAVATNPTAKLCGEMVREAMKQYGQ